MKNSIKVVIMFCAVAFGLFLFSETGEAATWQAGLAQTKDDTSGVTVKWNTYFGATASGNVYYKVYYGDTPTNLPRSASANVNTEQYISGLSEANLYYVKVLAFADSSYTQPLAESETIQVATSLSKVQNLTQKDATGKTITMSWTACPGATGYDVYRYNGYLNYTKIKSVQGTSATVGGLSASMSAQYFVLATRKTTAGYTATTSAYSYGQVMMKTAPARVPNIAVTSYYSNINVVYYGWNSVNGADGYQFQLKNYKGKNLKNSYENSTGIRLDPYWQGIFTKARARAYINVGNKRVYGPWSAYSYNAAQKNFKLRRKFRGKTIKVSFKKIKGATAYKLYISTKASGGFKKVATLKAKKRTYTIKKCGKKKLKGSKTYYIRVKYIAKVGKKKVVSGITGQGSI